LRKPFYKILALLSLSLVCWSLSFDPATMMRAEEIKPGMKGYGLTVFKGTKVEKFAVEIIGVLPKDNITGDVILARLSGGPITERNAKVIAGMSGSPVYIDGKLIGAVALTWSYSLEPLAGITPIENMIASANKEVPIGGEVSAKIKGSLLRGLGLKGIPGNDYITMLPIAVPLIASGFHPKALEGLAPLFERAGFLFMQAPAGGKMDVKAPLTPGAALGCQLMSGDMQMTAIGTLTYVDKDGEWLAFGHSIMDMGDAQMPAVSAYIHDIIPSMSFSTKIGSPGLPVGALTRDGYFAISGKVGQPPHMVPLSISVANGEKMQTFNVEVAKHPYLTNDLISSALSNALLLSFPDPVDAMTRVSFEIQLEGGKRLNKQDYFYSPYGVGISPSFFVQDILSLLSDNVFQAVYPERIAVRIEVVKGRKIASLQKVSVDKSIVKPGENLSLLVYLKEYGKEEPTTLSLNLPIPPQAPEGSAFIYVGGGGYIVPQVMGFKSPTDLSDMLEFIEDIPQNNQLITSLVMPRYRLQIGDKLFSPLPNGIEQMMISNKETAIRRIPYVSVTSLDTDWVVMGMQRLRIMISKTGKAIPMPPEAGPQPEMEMPNQEMPLSGEEILYAAKKISSYLAPFHKSLPVQQSSSQQMQAPQMSSPPSGETTQPQPVPSVPPAKPSKRIWIQGKYDDFSKGDIKNTLVTHSGEVILAPKWDKIARLPGSLLLSLVELGDDYLVSTLGSGAVYKVSQDGKVEEFLKTKEIGLKLFNWQGKLFAASFPGGNIYTVDTNSGSLSPFATLPVDYIWDILPQQDRLLLATGGEKGLLYSLEPSGKVSLVYLAPDQHILKIGKKDDAILLGTSPQGLVISYKEGEVTSFSTGGQSVGALLYSNGAIYAAASPGGKIWRIDGKGLSEIADTREGGIYSLIDNAGYLLIGTGARGRIYLLDPSQTDRWGFAFEAESSNITGLLKTSKGLLALGSNPPTIFLSQTSFASEGTFSSSVFDGGITCNWGRLAVEADVPSAANLEMETRSGNSSLPDAGWSAWAPLGIDGKIISPPARYLQYRAKLGTSDPSQTPVLHRVTVYLLPQNLPPTLKLESPSWGDSLSGSVDIKWTASDSNGDNLIAAVYISENGEDWQKLGEVAGKNQYKLDTKSKKDGRYLLKVSISDVGSNPPEMALSDEKTIEVIIDNTPPRITVLKGETKFTGGRVYLTGIVEDAISPITEVSYNQGGDVFYAATPLKGMFATPLESFSLWAPLPQGDAKTISIKIKAKDAAGNEATIEEKVSIAKEGKIEKVEETPVQKGRNAGGAQTSQGQSEQKINQNQEDTDSEQDIADWDEDLADIMSSSSF